MKAFATWDGQHWVQLEEPIDVTCFRYQIEQARAKAVPWDSAAPILRTLEQLDGEQLDQVGALIDELSRQAERRLL